MNLLKSSLFALVAYVQPSKRKIIFASISSALNKFCDIVPEILIAISIDVVVRQRSSVVAVNLGISDPATQLYLVGFATAFFWVMESVFEYLYYTSWHAVAQGVQDRLRILTYNKIQELDVAYFENSTTGGLLTVLQDDVQQLETVLSQGPNEIIQLLVNVLVIGAVFACVSPTLFFLTIVPIPFVVLIAYFFQTKLSRLYGSMRSVSGVLVSHVIHRLNGLTTIKSYNAQRYELAKFAIESKKYKQSFEDVNMITALYVPSIRMAVMFGFIATLIVGGLKVLNGQIEIHWYAELVFLTQRFLWPFTSLTSMSDMYEKSLASSARILQILHASPTIVDGKDAMALTACPGSIAFNDATFVYGSGYSVFHGLTLSITPGSMVAFVGATGSGKSTLAKLLLRFYDVQGGSITIDGHDIKNIKLHDLRASIGLVSQDIYIVDGTIADNIAYGSFNATRDEIIQAATLAQLHDFVMELAQGYDTKMEENGKNLSGGQRQRVSIARALLKKSCILIFDEATSALDNETEAEISKSMMLLKGSHTIIIIAHRLSTVRSADTIYVLDKGAIVESGSHDDLLQKNGAYAQLLQPNS